METAKRGIDLEIYRLAAEVTQLGKAVDATALAEALETRDRRQALRKLEYLAVATGLDVATLIDAEGVVLAQGHDPTHHGDDLTHYRAVQKALEGRIVTSIATNPAGLGIFCYIPVKRNAKTIGLLSIGKTLGSRFLGRLRTMFGVEVFVYQDATLQACTSDDQDAINSDNLRKLVRRAETKRELLLRREKLGARDYFIGVWPLYSESKRIAGVLAVASPLLSVIGAIQANWPWFLLSHLLITVVTGACGMVVSHSVIRPIRRLADAVRAVPDNLTTRVPVGKQDDELSQLEVEFNNMTRLLETTMTSKDRLEQQVAERTEHLDTALKQLQIEMDERGQIEEALQRSARLASLGTLAAGISHEINNPIGAILLGAEHLKRHGQDPDEKVLEMIQEDARRCGSIVKSLLQFAREEEYEKSLCDINDLILELVDTRRESAERKTVDVELELDPDLPRLEANPTAFGQVLHNLITNAVQASPRKGKVRIATEPGNDCVRILVRDEGEGLNEEQKRRVFDPFFTTRLEEGGTGLGLSIVHGIIAQHGGTIDLQSAPGQGTTVVLSLPHN